MASTASSRVEATATSSFGAAGVSAGAGGASPPAACAARQGAFGGRVESVDLVSVGNVGVAALHATALEGALFHSVQIKRALRAWFDVIIADRTKDQFMNTLHKALRGYVLPDLHSLIGRKLNIVEPAIGLGKLIKD